MRNSYNQSTITRMRGEVNIDQKLREFMVRVFMYMALGLSVTGFVAFMVSSTPALLHAIFGTPLIWVAMFAPVGIAFFLGVRIHALSASTTQLLFWVYSALMGVSLASMFVIYTGESIARIFFITASVFGSMSLYGYTTGRDLTAFGSFLFMGLIGLVIASLVNLFLHSSAVHMFTSAIAVLIFTGLTAYDTQVIKEMYLESDNVEVANKKAIFGALQLYLDFINIFISLLRLFGERK